MTFDVLVIGAGPAGCAAAIRAAQRGLKVGLAERSTFPRDRPGEALHPEAELVFRKMGIAEKIAAAGFIRTPGWLLYGKKQEVVLFASRGKLRFGYLAWRADLDVLLLDHAQTIGVKILQPARVTSVAAREGYARTNLGKIRFRYLVDASGANGLVQRNLGLDVKRVSPPLIARYGYVWGYPAPGIMPEFHEHACGWTWLARVKSDCHQFVRLALDKSAVLPPLPSPYAAVSHPRGADVTWRFVPACAGDGYFLCGDAASVLDPAAASGVERALASGRKAGESIVQLAEGSVDRGEAAEEYRKWTLRQFVRDARGISARYEALERPPDWISTVERELSSLKAGLNRNPLAISGPGDYPNQTMATKTTKKTATKKAAAATAGKNLATLTKAGIVPANYQLLTPAEKKAIETLSKSEVTAIISAKAKLGRNFSKHAAHGMYF